MKTTTNNNVALLLQWNKPFTDLSLCDSCLAEAYQDFLCPTRQDDGYHLKCGCHPTQPDRWEQSSGIEGLNKLKGKALQALDEGYGEVIISEWTNGLNEMRALYSKGWD